MTRLLAALALVLLSASAVRAHPPTTQPFDPDVAMQTARKAAIEQVDASSKSKDPQVHSHAIEAAQPLADRIVPIAQLGLEDQNPAVRFVALVTIGKLRLTDLAPAVKPLTEDKNQSVRAAALFALRQCGQKVDISPMAAMLGADDLSVRGNVAMLLGLMGDRSAVPLLTEMAKVPTARASFEVATLLRLQFAEAIVRLGDNSQLDAIRAGVLSKEFAEVRVLSMNILGDLGDRKMITVFQRLLTDKEVVIDEVRVAAAIALARLGDKSVRPYILQYAQSPDPRLREYVARGLALFPDDPGCINALLSLQSDKEESVRLSAAAAVLQGSK